MSLLLSYLKQNWRTHVILLVAPIVMLIPALLPGKTLVPAVLLGRMLPWHGMLQYPAQQPWSPLAFDGVAQFYPWRLLASNTWHSGFVPLWNPYQFCGTPFLANDQSAVMYPLNLIFEIMPVDIAFGWSAVLHLFLTGAFLFGYLIRRVSGRSALLGALIWQLSAWQISWLALPTFLCTSTWIPAILLGVDALLDRPNRRNVVLLGIAGAMMLLAGHLQIALYGVVLATVYTVAKLCTSEYKHVRTVRIFTLLSASVIAVLLSAPQILPTLELSHLSARGADSHPNLAGYQSYIALAMPWEWLSTLLVPSLFGRNTDFIDPFSRFPIPYPETACFVSVGGFLLAGIAVFSLTRKYDDDGTRKGQIRFWAVVALVSMLFVLGTPLNMVPYFGIPGFSSSGSPARVLVVWTLALAILAAHGLECISSRATPNIKVSKVVNGIVGWLVLLLAISARMLQSINPRLLGLMSIPSVFVGIVVLTLQTYILNAIYRNKAGHSGVHADILVGVVVIELLVANFGFNLASDRSQVYPVTPEIQWLQNNAANTRIMALNAPNGVYGQAGMLPPNAATVFGIRDIAGYDSLQTRDYRGWLNAVDSQDCSPPQNGNMDLALPQAVQSADAANVASAGIVVSPVDLSSTLGPPAFTDGQTWIYENPLGFNTLVERKPDIVSTSATRIAMNTQTGVDITVKDQNYPGWVASVNGHPVPLEGNGVIGKTVSNLKPGDNVTIAFQPDSFRVGLYLACFGLMILTGLLVSSGGQLAKR